MGNFVCVTLSLYLSFCDSLSCSFSSPDDKLSENIWFVWSKTSFDGDNGDVTMETNKQTTLKLNNASSKSPKIMASSHLPCPQSNLPHHTAPLSLSSTERCTVVYWPEHKQYKTTVCAIYPEHTLSVSPPPCPPPCQSPCGNWARPSGRHCQPLLLCLLGGHTC